MGAVLSFLNSNHWITKVWFYISMFKSAYLLSSQRMEGELVGFFWFIEFRLCFCGHSALYASCHHREGMSEAEFEDKKRRTCY